MIQEGHSAGLGSQLGDPVYVFLSSVCVCILIHSLLHIYMYIFHNINIWK